MQKTVAVPVRPWPVALHIPLAPYINCQYFGYHAPASGRSWFPRFCPFSPPAIRTIRLCPIDDLESMDPCCCTPLDSRVRYLGSFSGYSGHGSRRCATFIHVTSPSLSANAAMATFVIDLFPPL